MKKIVTIMAFCLAASGPAAVAQRLTKAGEGYSRTSVNTAVFRTNSIVSSHGYQFVAYYDSTGCVTIARRKLGTDAWETTHTQYSGKVEDAHNVISIMADGDGYLHMAFDHHGNKLRYCRSVKPLEADMGPLETMIGTDEDDVTYPEFYRMADGDLLFAYRSGASGNGNMVMNRYSVADKRWTRVQTNLIDGEGQRNAYWQMCVDDGGTIHVSWVWRETPAVNTNHDLCYARSYDKGRTWQKADGTPYTLPITAANAEYAVRIPQNSELINQTSMCADKAGNPCIATYWRSQDSDVPQYRIVWHDGSEWHAKQVSDRTTPFSLSGIGTKMIPIARPRIAMDSDRVYMIFRDEERGSRVSVATADSVSATKWNVADLTSFSVGSWEPSYDTELWRSGHLHIYVQATGQGDGEKTVDMLPQPVYVLEIEE